MQLRPTKDIHALTAELGLTRNESEVYVYLLTQKSVSGNSIYLHLGLDKSSVYRALHSLHQKNLVYWIGEERNRQFSANPPETLLQLAQQKLDTLTDTKEQMAHFIKNLSSLAGNEYLKKNITVLDGIEGYSQFLEKRLDCETGLIRDISGRTTAASYFDDYDAYMSWYINKRVEKNIFLRQLVPYGSIDSKWERSSKEMRKEARELPKDFEAEVVFSSWDNNMGFFSKEKGTMIGFIVKDQLIVNLMNSMFDMIWNLSKPSE
jgi:sugar-specific transcriptional regulator TrmB